MKTKRDITTITIVLTEDQRTTIRRELGVDLSEWKVDLTLPGSQVGHLGTLPDQPRGSAVFLTDAQRAIIKEKADRDCDYIQIETRPLLKYGGPPPTDR